MYECRVKFEHCGKSFLSPAIYKSVLAKKITMYGSVFQASSHFRSASNDNAHIPRLPSLVHRYRWYIISGVTPHHGQRLVVACPCRCNKVMVYRMLLMHSVMKCAMWTLVVSCDCLKNVRSILYQSAV